ncbi:MAG: AAA family ATPase [Actinophytocola sp.]|uniref:cytidylate kinase family protein n=1 Tax=Actinophytocola sp. TaxID=1872138 RepID=UPI00132484DB|nr:cytidylate kinase family protein [Actinophytocola sp.]MPZ80450.1 AAA family ATPase [Actinophytocola sp.]
MNRLPHVAISGELGSGKSSVARRLAQLYSMRFVSTGDIQRSMAKSLNLSTLETNWLAERDDMIDSQVDQVTRDLGASAEPIVFDSRMAWRMVPKSFKVHLIVDPTVSAVRLHQTRSSPTEQYESRNHARDLAEERYQSEQRRFLSTYGVDVFQLRNYDLVIDTSTAPIELVTDTVRLQLEAVIAESDASARRPRLFVQPRRILPDSADWAKESPSADTPQVAYSRPTFCSISGHSGVLGAIARDESLIEVDLVAEGAEPLHSGGPTVRQYVDQLAFAAWTSRWNEEYGLHHPPVGPSVGG